MLSLNRYVSTLSLIFCKAKSRCSVDGQVSWPFPSEIIGDDTDVFATATAYIDSTMSAKMRRKTAIIVEVTVAIRTCITLLWPMTICGLIQNCVGVGMKLYYFNYLLTSRKECQLLNLLTSRKECTPLHSFLPVLATREIRGLNSVGVHKEQCLCILLGGRSFLPVYITVLGGYALSCQLLSGRQECRGSYTLSCLLVNWEGRVHR